jgi:DNA-binding CsgD family transcriptional regulator
MANDQYRHVMELLSKRELQIYELVAKGYSRSRIADLLKISPKTVDSHLDRIKAKLNLQRSLELTKTAMVWSQHRKV